MEAISVIIPTFNRVVLLRRAIESVLAAVEDIDEIIVVDDGSTDGTEALVNSFGDRIRYIKTPNRGAGAARNTGIKTSSHDLVAFADSDDEWLPEKMTIQRPLMSANRSLVFCFSDFGQLYPDGKREPHYLIHWHEDTRGWDKILGPGSWYSEILPLPGDQTDFRVHTGSLYRAELRTSYINVNTLLVRKSLAGSSFYFAEDLPTYEDWDCFAKLSRLGICAYLDFDTALQRSHGGPRLTNSSTLICTQTRIISVLRNWSVDRDFMKLHGREVNKLLAQLRRRNVGLLLKHGRADEARTLIPTLQGRYIEWLVIRIYVILVRFLRWRR